VHEADYLVGGCAVLQAIDSHGNCLRRYPLRPDVDAECARVWLEGLIDHYDPLAPRLTLIKPEPGGMPRAAFILGMRHALRR